MPEWLIRVWRSARTAGVLPRTGRLLAVLLVYKGLEWIVMRGYRLPEPAYGEPWIFGQLLRAFVPDGLGGSASLLAPAPVVALAFLLWIGRRTVLCTWVRAELSPGLRVVVAVLAAISAWYFATYPKNLYFGLDHDADRLLLFAFAGLAVWRPIFALPLVAEAFAVMGQFEHPLGGYEPTHPQMALRILTLFLAWFASRSAAKRLGLVPGDFIFLTITLVASAYLRCGVGKVLIGWLDYGHIYHLLFNAYANGWLGFLAVEQIEAVGRWIAPLDPLFVAGTVLVELVIVGMFWRHRVAVAFLVLSAGFHVAIFAMSGICFWQWTVVDALLAAVLVSRWRDELSPGFGGWTFLLSVPFILGGVLWFRPVGLNWLDSAMTYTFRFEGVGESGRSYSLPPEYFSPYEYEFTLGPFRTYVDEPTLQIYWGATSHGTSARALVAKPTADNARRLEQEFGTNRYSESLAAETDSFLRRWVIANNESDSDRDWWDWIRAPPQLWTSSRADAYDASEPIVQVRVHWVTSLYNGVNYLEFRDVVVRTIDIPHLAGHAPRPYPKGTLDAAQDPSRTDDTGAGASRPLVRVVRPRQPADGAGAALLVGVGATAFDAR